MFKILAILVLLSIATAYTIQSNVYALTADDFDSALNQFDNILVKFYAPWCGHCKKLAPTYIEAATALAEGGSKAKLADVDCTIHKAVCSKYGVKGYPTVMFFSKGKQPEKYADKRQKQAIVNWVRKASGESIPLPVQEEQEQQSGWTKDGQVIVLSQKNFKKALAEFSHILVKFYAPWCGHCKNLAPTYKQAAESLKDLTDKVFLAQVDCTVHKQPCSTYGVRGYPTVMLFSQGKQQPIKFTAKRQKSAIIDWLKENTGFDGQKKEDVGQL